MASSVFPKSCFEKISFCEILIDIHRQRKTKRLFGQRILENTGLNTVKQVLLF